MLKDMGIKAHKTSQGAGGTTVTMQDQNATFPGTTNGKEPMAVPDAIDQSPGPHSPNAPATAPRTPSIQPRIVDVPAGTVGDMATTASEDADWESMHPEEGKGFRWHGEPPVETVKHDRDLNDDDRKWLAQMKIKGSWKTAALDVVFRNERGFVTDFGARQEMVSGEGISGSIPRYGVWEGKKGIKGGRPQVTFTSDDLEECKGNLGEGNGLPSTGLPATGLRHGDPEEMWEKESASDGLDDETMREAMSLLDKQGAAPAAPPATVSPNVEQNKAIAPGAQPPAPGGSTVAILPGQDEEETGRHTVEPELQNPKYHMMSGFYGTAGADDLLASEEARLASQDED